MKLPLGFCLVIALAAIARAQTSPPFSNSFVNFETAPVNLTDGKWHFVAASVARGSTTGGKGAIRFKPAFEPLWRTVCFTVLKNRLVSGACPRCATPIPGRWDARVEGTTRTHGIPLPVL